MVKWLAIYRDEFDAAKAATIEVADPTTFPFGVDHAAWDIEGDPGEMIFVELPDDPEFRPMVVDATTDDEVAMQFVTA